MTFLVLACALPQFQNWWPFFVIAFYLLAPLPTVIARRCTEDSGSSPSKEFGLFLTTGLVISAFALPLVLARSPSNAAVIAWGAAGLVTAANIVVFLTILGFFIAFDNEDVDYSMW
uniref:EOG090X0J87 n=1 Tax=Lynceus sp. MCZ IZ 141354 TaxID=1930659 RepID=A0A9N6WTN1_9CRUS|nr:EOG090X0J87 [Lynceus sp. MCZ IZ 141354]